MSTYETVLRSGLAGVPDYELTEFAPERAKYCVLIPIINEGARIRAELERAFAAGVPGKCDIILCDGGSTDGSTGEAALRQRPDTGLLAGLWEYPHVNGSLEEADAAAQLSAWGVTPHRWVKRLQFHHIFTHIRWEMTGYVVQVQGTGCADWLWCSEEERSQRAVPSAFEVLTRELPQG